MNRHHLLAPVLLSVVLLVLATASAQACDGCCHGLGYWGYGYSGSLYGLGFVPVPPYFALHPPVYYGEQVYRSYGDSPYAYHSAAVRVSQGPPKEIINSHVVPIPQNKLPKTQDRVAASPPVIHNPFFSTAAVPLAANGK